MKYAVPVLSFIAVTFGAYVQTKSSTSPDYLKYFMWACCGSVLTSSIFTIRDEYRKSKKELIEKGVK